MIFSSNLHNNDSSASTKRAYLQKKKILQILYSNCSLTTSEIGEKLGMSLPTVLRLLRELENQKFIELVGVGKSQGGRKPTMFSLRKESVVVVVCELGKTKAKVGVFNAHTQLIVPVIEFDLPKGNIELVDKLYENVLSSMQEYGMNCDKIAGIGVAISDALGGNLTDDLETDLDEFGLLENLLEQRFKCRSFVSCVSSMSAYGEYINGNAQQCRNALVVTWSETLSLGIIFNGVTYSGASGIAGEFSHMRCDDNGSLCHCGKRGCLNTIASIEAIEKWAQKELQKGIVSQLNNENSGEMHCINQIIDAAKFGDEFSITLLSRVSWEVGKALSNIVQILNPDAIVIGGIVSQGGNFILSAVQQAINRYCLPQLTSQIKITISKNWNESCLLGTATSLYNAIFEDTNSEIEFASLSYSA